MKHFKFLLLLSTIIVLISSCRKDDIDANYSVFSEKNVASPTEFDKWLEKTYTEPYNIRFLYKYVDQNNSMGYNVSPASIQNSIAMAKLVKYVWMDAYSELMGEEFLKKQCFKQFQLIGSAQYNVGNGSKTLGIAEGGVRINLYQVNDLDINNLFVETKYPFNDTPVEKANDTRLDLNYNYFHTMHHEFAHILSQLKDYSTDFQTVSSEYHSTDWINIKDSVAVSEGFVTGYASSEFNEDFAETFACYVTDTDEMWRSRLSHGVKVTTEYVKNPQTGVLEEKQTLDTKSRDLILTKLSIIRSYLKDSWGVDIDRLRQIVLRRTSEIKTLDLKTLN